MLGRKVALAAAPVLLLVAVASPHALAVGSEAGAPDVTAPAVESAPLDAPTPASAEPSPDVAPSPEASPVPSVAPDCQEPAPAPVAAPQVVGTAQVSSGDGSTKTVTEVSFANRADVAPQGDWRQADASVNASPCEVLKAVSPSAADVPVVVVSNEGGHPTVDVVTADSKADAAAIVASEQDKPETLSVSVDTKVTVDARVLVMPDTPYWFPSVNRNDPSRAIQAINRDLGPEASFRALTPWNHIEYPWLYTRGSGITVAVVDTGVDGTHEDLAGQVLAGYDFVTGATGSTAGWADGSSHGTHVAGIIAAKENNGLGIAGIAPEVKILPVRVLGSDGSGSSSNVARGVIAATDAGVQIINLSLGSENSDPALQTAVEYAQAHGVVVIAAGGNLNAPGFITTNGWNYPASYAGVIGVGSSETDCGGIGGPHIDISANGCAVLSTIPGNRYAQYSGTSMATPQVSAEMALLLANGLTVSRATAVLLGNTARLSSYISFDCVDAPDSTPQNRRQICTPNGVDEETTALMFGTGTMVLSDAILEANSVTSYTRGSYFAAPPVVATPSAPAPAPAPAPAAPSGGSSGGSSSSAPAAGGGGGGGGSLHEITGLRPASGPLAGGNTMSIVGYGFTGVREVRIGDVATQFTLVNDAHIEVVVPAGVAAGAVDVSVVLPPAVGRAFAPRAYVYVADVVAAPVPVPPVVPMPVPAPVPSGEPVRMVVNGKPVVKVSGSSVRVSGRVSGAVDGTVVSVSRRLAGHKSLVRVGGSTVRGGVFVVSVPRVSGSLVVRVGSARPVTVVVPRR